MIDSLSDKEVIMQQRAYRKYYYDQSKMTFLFWFEVLIIGERDPPTWFCLLIDLFYLFQLYVISISLIGESNENRVYNHNKYKLYLLLCSQQTVI